MIKDLDHDVTRYSGVYSVDSIEEFYGNIWKIPNDKQIRINVGKLTDGKKLWGYLNLRELDDLLVKTLNELTKKPVTFFSFKRKRLIKKIYGRLVLLRGKGLTDKKSLKNVYKKLTPAEKNYFLCWKKQ